MIAEPAAQERLLELQAADTELAQLAHRRAHLPELEELARLVASADELALRAADLGAQAADSDTAQRRLENEIDGVRARADRDRERLTGGGLPAKELDSLQHEVATLARRQGSLEDELLELMEHREGLDGERAELAARRAEADAERGALTSRRDEAMASIDAASATRAAQRAALADGLPADLLGLYDKIRAASGGVGAAALRQRRCEGCRIELAGNELTAARVAAPETVLRCDNCRRILVRTDASGL
ncbi:MAG: C4-type zinc ribbon domain-containing protein [Actinomycetia bacterium]|nr:C4-type zinc ribbon domain-containing protein [Actinomycetes bacterium]